MTAQIQWLTKQDMAIQLGVSLRTIQRRIKSGDLIAKGQLVAVTHDIATTTTTQGTPINTGQRQRRDTSRHNTECWSCGAIGCTRIDCLDFLKTLNTEHT